jgi:hypothetical protein
MELNTEQEGVLNGLFGVFIHLPNFGQRISTDGMSDPIAAVHFKVREQPRLISFTQVSKVNLIAHDYVVCLTVMGLPGRSGCVFLCLTSIVETVGGYASRLSMNVDSQAQMRMRFEIAFGDTLIRDVKVGWALSALSTLQSCWS